MLRVNLLMALKLVLIGIPGKLGKLVLIHQIQLALSLPLLLALYLAFERLLALNFIFIWIPISINRLCLPGFSHYLAKKWTQYPHQSN